MALKAFRCGDVVPGCQAVFHGVDDEDVLRQVGAHAVADHGMAAVPPSLVDEVRRRITSA